MLVKDFMTKEVVTIKEEQTILEARETLRGKNLRSLPVVDDLKRVRGIITVNDIGRASPSPGSTLSKYEANYLLGRLRVKDVMSRNVFTVNASDSIEYVAFNLFKLKVNALPVVDDNSKLVGIIAQNDMFRAFAQSMSVDRPCTRISLIVNDEVGVLAEVTGLFRDYNANILSLLCKPLGNGKAEIVARATMDSMDIVEKLREAGYQVSDVMTMHGVS